MIRRMNKSVVTLLCLIVLAGGFLLVRSMTAEQRTYPVIPASKLDLHAAGAGDQEGDRLPYYMELTGESGAESLATGQQGGDGRQMTVASVEAASFSGKSGDADIDVTRDDDSGRMTLHWKNDQGWVEWKLYIPNDGLYELQVDYMPVTGSYDPISRGIQIDGEYPFKEAQNLMLDRYWKDAQFPYVRNKLGNEVRPVQTEIAGWKTMAISDFASSSRPLQWRLSAGEHVMRMTGGKEAVVLAAMRWVTPREIPGYSQYVGDLTEGDTGGGEPWFHVYEAERFLSKSKPGIQTASIREPNMSPDPKGRIVYNAIGGERWKNAGEWVEWEIDAPHDGFYELGFKYAQTWWGKSNVYRTVAIDGEVPFRELLHYKLPANGHFQITSLQGDDGMPYKIYLREGTHVVRMTADATQVEPAVIALKQSIAELGQFDRKIRRLTGNYGFGRGATNVDANRTWDLETYYPHIQEDLTAMIGRLRLTADYLLGVHQHETDAVTSINMVIATLQSFQDHIDKIPDRIADLSVAQNTLALWLGQMPDQTAMLDYIVLRTPGADDGLRTAGALQYIGYSALDFARTFFMTYNEKASNDPDAITVWVQRGRDYADLLNQMIGQEFTPATGIKVNVNLMPNPNALILSNAAGDQPDAVLGASGDMPVDYAMRGAVQELSGYDGFDEVMRRFVPGVMNSYRYDGGTYGLPENQNFYAMYYRSDILESLGLNPPETWDDVYRMLPTLQEQGMVFFYPPKDFSVFFLEHGAPFYSSTGTESRLGEKNALLAFTQWTDLFAKRLFPQDVPSFIEHFRRGDVPIGIADFSTYVMLNVAAPDIAGQWKMVPIPGLAQADGTIERWAQQPTSGAMIMKNSDKKEQAWQFLKWWTSADVQSRYGQDIESYYGLEYRWNSANVEALLSMPWPQEDLAVIKEQVRWASNIPIVPGHYFLPRIMDFAWNDTVLRRVPAKEALENGNNDLQREMRRKLADFGLPPNADLRVPGEHKPYEFKGGAAR